MFRIGFVVEQTLGHITFGQNLQKNVLHDSTIDAHWALPSWETNGIASLVTNWTFRAGWQARKAIAAMQRQAPMDVLFFHTQVTAVFAQKWLNKIPSIISLDATSIQYDSLGEFYDHHQGPSWLEKWKQTIDCNCFSAAKHVVTWSEWTKQGLINDYGVTADKITVIPPGVNIHEWSQPNLHVPKNENVVKILFVGGNFKRKGGFLLLEAFRALRHEFSSGNGQSDEKTIELHLVTHSDISPEPGVFLYSDMQPNSRALKRLYHESDIFCLPTYGDFLPMVLSEAAVAGLPSISTSVAAIPEIVHNEETGLLVPVGDMPALKEALKKLILNPGLRYRQGEGAKKLVNKKFDAKENSLKLVALLKQVSNKSKI